MKKNTESKNGQSKKGVREKNELTRATSEYLLSPFISQRSKSDLEMLMIFLTVTQVVCDRAETRNLGPLSPLSQTHWTV